MTQTTTRKAKKQPRTCRVIARSRTGRPAVLLITVGKAEATYTLDEFAPDCEFDGRAFRFTKVAATDVPGCWELLRDEGGDPAVRDVFLARNGQDHHCCCRGHRRWGRCKHRDCVLALIERGEL